MDFSKYIFRSHMVGKIISVPKPLTKDQNETLMAYRDREKGNGKPLTPKQKEALHSLEHKLQESKKYKLSDGQKSLLAELVFAEKFGRSKVLYADQITKGLETEKDSRDLLSRALGMFLVYSEERKTNQWTTGKLDIKPSQIILDLKNAFSWESFCNILQEKPNEIYLRQVDSYMELWGLKESLIVHTLVDTPKRIVDKKIYQADFSQNILSMDGNVRDEMIPEVKKIVYNHIFTGEGLEKYCAESVIVDKSWFLDFKEIPEKDRIHMIPHQFDPVRIEQRNECIKLAREYMNKVTPINNFQTNLIT